MRDKSRLMCRWLPLAAALFFPAAALAEAGLRAAGSVAEEVYELPLSTITIDWQRITVTPWWQNSDWLLSADLPFISRDAERRGPFGGLLAAESDSGLGDIRLRAKRSWAIDGDFLVAYLGSFVKLPTGDENAGTLVVPAALTRPTRQGLFSLGSGTTDFGITPGVVIANHVAWATAEAGYLVSSGGSAPQEDRPLAFFGLGLTPASFIELSVEFDYEGEAVAGAGELQQFTYTLSVMPTKNLSLSLSTYTDNSAVTPDENWTLGIGGDW